MQYNFSKDFKEIDIDTMFANSDLINTEDNRQFYSFKLPTTLMGLFDTIEYQTALIDGKFVRSDDGKLSIAGVALTNKLGTQQIDTVKNFVTYILSLYGKDDDDWTEVDEMRIKSGVWRGRTIFQDGIAFFMLDEDSGNVRFEFTSLKKLIERLN